MIVPIFRARVSRLSCLWVGLSLPLVLSSGMMARAAGFISVPASGIGPLTFDLVANPTPTNGFSTQTIGGAGNSVNSPAAMDLAVPTNDIANINLILPQSNTQPPSTQAFARYNYGGFFLQTRPTGNAYTILVATFRNATGADRSRIVLTYDQGFAQSGGTEQVPGLWVYYSLTGAAGTWQKLDALSGREGTFSMATTITLSSAWEVGANLYILWADDNSDGFTDGNFTIDNLSLQWDGCGDLPIVVQPHDITIESCRSSNLTVTASGAGPITYQWYKQSLSNPIPGATGSTLNFFNAQVMDTGTYFVVVTGPSCGSVESTHVTVTVNQDSTQPDVLSAISLFNETNVVVTFSEPMFAPTTGNPDSYLLHPTSAGSDTIPLSAALNAAGTVLTLAFSEPRAAGTEYELIIDSSVSDACGNPLATERIPLWYQVRLMTFEDTIWKFDDTGKDLGIDWHSAGYDDSGWQSGPALLDVKIGATAGRTNIPGLPTHPIKTFLTLHTATSPFDTNDIPTVYFRSHFSVPAGGVKALSLRTIVDDADVAYINDGPAVHQNNRYTSAVDAFEYCSGNIGDAIVEGPFNLSLADVHDGDNLISVSVHQNGATSSDMTLAYELLGVITTPPLSTGPSLTVAKDPNTGVVSLTWPAGSGALLYEANAVDALGAWSVVAGASDGSYSFTPTAVDGTQKFYVLRK